MQGTSSVAALVKAMLLERIECPELGHVSYVLGSEGEAVVIDARRDIDAYLKDVRITNVLETHGHEDFVPGSLDLCEATGARLCVGPGRSYGHVLADNERIKVGRLRIEAWHTPGHTKDSVCYLVTDTQTGDDPILVFTGDTLLVGSVGRTDLYDREQAAEDLHASLQRLLGLPDGTVVLPTHTAGSVCGADIAKRPWSTIGHERHNNPQLRRTKDSFLEHHATVEHPFPPYFHHVERLVAEGPPPWSPQLRPVAPTEGMDLIDVRSPEAICGCRVPGATAVPVDLMSWAGWFVKGPVTIMAEDAEQAKTAARRLGRLGIEVDGYVQGGMPAWQEAGFAFTSIPTVHAADLKGRVLDVRSKEEFEEGHLEGAHHVYLGRLPDAEVFGPLTTFCSRGARATVAAALLQDRGIEARACLGSLEACQKSGCEARIVT